MTYLPIEFHQKAKLPQLPADFCSNPELAWTIPKTYYTSQEVFKVEEEKIFADTWICVAHRSELAEANQYVTREVIGENVLIVRGKDKVLRAFYNVCPHRGHQLLEGSGKAKNVITCPYHAWTFKLDGALAHANNCDHVMAFDKENASLVPVKVEEYAGFVFINLNPNAGTVEEQLPGMEARLRAACPVIDDLKLAARFVSETPANWKSIVDNYLECYHCGPAHPGFSDSVKIDQYTHTLHGNWTLQFGHAESSERSFKLDPSIKDASFQGFWAWPCTMFNVPPGADFMTVIYEFPVNAEVTLQHYDIYFLNEELTDYQKNLIEWYRNVFRPEDLRLVESVQKGLKSRGYRGQGRIMVDQRRSGISEHGIAHFHHLLAQKYQD
ncbi:ring-hydroxylating oxygenase subunit alpha [Burkholderia multivorans]|uniref:aromatic ring-hydroxylating oxygenase subunit alpha n=1 Tax=Burkholderia multivorans TaxID=87883 RepID=UPI000D007EED|nr:ring-hydroxylating oxygenase subunit alpha [Burkholderia multivorans]MBU9278634.1 ring-hydroxylating oxygenase subunit alpha [Burkholderia multivorans]MBU9326254.1 ring-hydroxylating oxygenase subunit alpha [Burkholderia multivorans]MBU9459144.1 ring-hydroxylating oxygenase subunit alpha [Burkholderia multivorans]MBU9522684.1 ring-hydroxylating oxygenase subunit alpha [Burkholderia multivorans]MBU9529409.1 ring-hydroxylating oxygenase subunit alpha [Burkholderia multivorans]